MIPSSTSPLLDSGLVSASAEACPLAVVQDVSKSFGGVHALSNVSFEVLPNTVTALIGPNCAGKTTLFNCMTGFAAPDNGSVTFAGRRVDTLAPHRVARLGMVRTFQSIKMLSGLTVYESLLTAQPRQHSGTRPSFARQRRRAGEVLERLELADVADRVCTELPLLAQRKIEVGRALMTDPLLIMLDEPSAGATVAEREQLALLVRELRNDGVTVMVIEHNVPFVMAVSDHIVVLDFGKVVAAGNPAEILANDVVQEIYLGT